MVALIDQPLCRPAALGFCQTAGDDVGQLSQTSGAHRGLIAASPFRGTRRVPTVNMQDPPVAELEEMACGEFCSREVVGPYDLDPFSCGCASDDNGRSLAADGREVGASCAGAEQDHRVTLESQQILRGALFPTIWCDAGQDQFVAAVLRSGVELGHQLGVELVTDAEADSDQPGLLSAEQPGAGVRLISDLGRGRTGPGAGLLAGARLIAEHDRDEWPGDASPEGNVFHGWSARPS